MKRSFVDDDDEEEHKKQEEEEEEDHEENKSKKQKKEEFDEQPPPYSLREYDINLLKSDIIEEMRCAEDVIWRFFNFKQKELRLSILRKLFQFLKETYGSKDSKFFFSTEMLQYFEGLTIESCTNTNEQDFFFFSGLFYCPKLFFWMKTLHQRLDLSLPESKLKLKYENEDEQQFKNKKQKNDKMEDIKKITYQSKENANDDEYWYIEHYNFHIWSIDWFVNFINVPLQNIMKRNLTGQENGDIDSIVRDLRYEYVTICGFPIPSSSDDQSFKIWNRKLQDIISEESK